MRTFLLSLSLFCAATLTSMAIKVKGVVKDAGGALPGASVSIKGTHLGTESDDEGNFEIEAKPGATLIIQYLGYEDNYATVPKNGKSLVVKMKEVEA
jgi:hypothetical protein